MEGNAGVSNLDQPAEVVTLEIGKATVDVEAKVIRDFAEQSPGVASVACPKCHRQVGIAIDKPYRHVCGAVLIAKRGE